MDYHYQQLKENKFHFILERFDESMEEGAHFMPKHWHEYLEIPMTISGSGLLWVDGQTYNFKQPNVAFINPKQLHYVHGNQPFNKNLGYCLQIDLQYFSTLFPSLNKQYNTICSKNLSTQIIEKTIVLDKSLSLGDFETFKALIDLLETISLQEGIQTKESSDYNKERILEIVQYIQSNYQEQLTIDELAKRFSISPGYLSRFFKTAVDQSIHKYITDVRLQHAYNDLLFTDMTVLDIALKNGFPNSKSLIQAFKNKFQKTPNQIRKKN